MMQPVSLIPLPLAASAHGAPSAEDVAAIVRAAIRAPSGDNTQPWRFTIDGATVHVTLDEERMRCGGFGGIAALMSVGGLIESVRLAAGRRAFGVLVVREGEQRWRMEIGRGRVAHSDLAGWLTARGTDRSPYAVTPLARRDAEKICSESGSSTRVAVTSRRSYIERAALAADLAERVRFDTVDPGALFKWLRFTPREATRSRDGLDLRLLSVAWHERQALRLMGSKLAMAVMRRFGGARIAGKRARRDVLAAGGVGVIVQEGLRPEAFVESGRTMIRAWLRATALGYAFAPVTMAALLPLTRHLGDRFAKKADRQLDAAEGILRTVFDVGADRFPVFMFRVGEPIGKPVDVRSERRSLASFEGVGS